MIFKVMDSSGDTATKFDIDKAEGLKAANDRFRELTGKGFMAIAPSGDGSPGTLLRKFDPTVKEVTFQPQLIGG
jgi:hypothetical protein